MANRLLRVTLEYDDEILMVEGPDAELWESGVAAQAVMSEVHGGGFPKLNWKRVPKHTKRRGRKKHEAGNASDDEADAPRQSSASPQGSWSGPVTTFVYEQSGSVVRVVEASVQP